MRMVHNSWADSTSRPLTAITAWIKHICPSWTAEELQLLAYATVCAVKQTSHRLFCGQQLICCAHCA